MSEDVVTHQMFDSRSGILPCCGLHRYEVRQSDRVALGPNDVADCAGRKRYDRPTNREDRRKRSVRKTNGLWRPS